MSSNPRNLADLGARLQKTTNTELSASGNIRATTFQGSGRLLTDILSLTGGRIVIPVGSTREYKNLYSAFNSISALLFDDDATVTFKLDPEVINEPQNLDLTHPSGNVISISGTSLPWQSVETNGTTVSPVKGVSGTNVFRLSAEIDFDTNYNIPVVGDYISIATVSARDVRGFNGHDSITNGIMLLNYSALVNTIPMATMGASTRPVRAGDVMILTYPRSGASTISEYRTVSGFALYQNSATLSSTSIYFNEPAGTFTGTFRHTVIVQVGTPTSYRGSGRTISQTAASTTLTFLNGGGADSNTNTFLNPGDVIHALGQMRVVQTVAANNTCTISVPFRTGTGSGWTDAITTVPYLISTPGAHRYRGLHRVVRVVGNRVTIEMLDYGYRTGASSPAVGYGVAAINNMLPPVFGISCLGNEMKYPAETYTAQFEMSRSVIFKSVLNFTSSTFVKNNACIHLRGNIQHLDSLCIVCTRSYPYIGISVGTDGDDQAPSKIDLGVFGGGLGLYGYWINGIMSTKNTITNGYNLNYTMLYNNYPDTSIAFLPNPILYNYTNLNIIDSPYNYDLKQSFLSIYGNVYGYCIYGADSTASGKILGFVARSINVDVYTPGTIRVGALVGNTTYRIYSTDRGDGLPYFHSHISCTENADGYTNSIFGAISYGEHFHQTTPTAKGYSTGTADALNWCMIVASPNSSYDHYYVNRHHYIFYDMQNMQNIFPDNRSGQKPVNIAGSYHTGGGGFYFYYNDYGFTTGADGGNNPGQFWYFMEATIVGGNGVTGDYGIFNTNDLITNCTYAGGILNSTMTNCVYNHSMAVRSGNTTNSTRQQGSLSTVIPVGLNTTSGNSIQY